MLCFTTKQMKNAKTLVCWHQNCTDGFTAAIIAYTKFGTNADYLAVQYNKEYDIEIFRDKDVYIVDFSFSRELCEQINEISNSLVILDHHKTAQDNLKDLPYAIFDMTKSGALITWDYFYPNNPAPTVIKYVSDYDLWNHHTPEIKWFNKVIRCYPFNLETWSEIFSNCFNDAALSQFVLQGQAIEKFTDQQVDSITYLAQDCIIDGVAGLIVNCSTVFTSDVGNKLADKSKTFGATYVFNKDGDILISLRSIGEFDVSAIAENYNGGGHKNSAGCKVPMSQFKFVDGQIIINK